MILMMVTMTMMTAVGNDDDHLFCMMIICFALIA